VGISPLATVTEDQQPAFGKSRCLKLTYCADIVNRLKLNLMNREKIRLEFYMLSEFSKELLFGAGFPWSWLAFIFFLLATFSK